MINAGEKSCFYEKLYAEFLGKPLGEKSHHLLHTHYTPRGKFME